MNNDKQHSDKAGRSLTYFLDLLPEISGKRVLRIGNNADELEDRLMSESTSYKWLSGVSSDYTEISSDVYDLIILEAETLSGGISRAELTDVLFSLLADKGTILMAVNNRLAFQYIVGYREKDEEFFSAPCGYNQGKRIDFESLVSLKNDKKDSYDSEVYYPFPNYQYCSYLYSDERLPKEGELKSQFLWVEEDWHMAVFDDYAVLDSFIKNGMFRQTANSYIIVMEKK
jgi:hypothetical protein